MDRKQIINLSDEERAWLQEVVKERRGSAGRIRRAKILLYIDSQSDNVDRHHIAHLYGVSVETVNRICSRYFRDGLRAVVFASRFTEQVELSDEERSVLCNILVDPSSPKYSIKTVRILLAADSQGKNADIREIAAQAGVHYITALKTIAGFKKKRLEVVLKVPDLFRFFLRNEDRVCLQELLERKKGNPIPGSWKHKRILVLLDADKSGPKISFETVSKSTGVGKCTVRKICRNYMSSGLSSVVNLNSHRYVKPKRLHVVRLDTNCRERIEKIATTSRSKQFVQRAEILLFADENGPNLHNNEIAACVGVCLNTVQGTPDAGL